MRINVVFPAPFSPRSACTVPGRTSSDADASACVAPYRLSMPRSASATGIGSLDVGSIIERGSESRGCRDEAPWDAECALDLLTQRTNAERLRGIVADVEHGDSQLGGLDGGVVRSFAHDERIDGSRRRFAERVAR